jgi:hypothetical protein
MLLPIPAVFLYRSDQTMPWPVWLVVFVAVVIASTASSWQFIAQRWNGYRGRNWPTVSAVIDLVSVQRREESGGKGRPIITWVALLTYVYRIPDLQTGDYDRSFSDEDEAKDWANSLKGCAVMVHVDPKDPAHSVLRKEDLDNAVSAAPDQKLTTSN